MKPNHDGRRWAAIITALVCTLAASSGWAQSAYRVAPPEAGSLWARENLLAWIVSPPFDAKKRGPEARAQMLKQLGFKQYAYGPGVDMQTLDAEIAALKKHGIHLLASYFPFEAEDSSAKATLEVFRRHHVRPQLWVMQAPSPKWPKSEAEWAKLMPEGMSLPWNREEAAKLSEAEQAKARAAFLKAVMHLHAEDMPKTPQEQAQHLTRETNRIHALVKLAEPYGMKIALYNHNGWFGMVENQLAIIERLNEMGVTGVGIVYNFSHARDELHDDSKNFAELWEKMKAHVVAVNITGMRWEGEYIYPSQGDSELDMMRTIQESGWRGPIGVIGEKGGDAEITLRNYLMGLDWLAAELKRSGSGGPRPFPPVREHRQAEAQRKSVEPPGKAVFQKHCAQCHDNSASGAPETRMLRLMTASTIHMALTAGRMRSQGAQLSEQERRQVAEYLSGRSLSEARGRPPKACQANANWFDPNQGAVGTGWGIDPENTRLIPAAQAGLSAAELKRLQLRWAFAFPGASTAVSQPLVAGGGLFVGSEDGTVYALDAHSGCLHWTFKARAAIQGGVVLRQQSAGGPMLFFGDRQAYVYAVDAVTGRLGWEAKIDDHPAAAIMGTPALMDDRLFVPVLGSGDEAPQRADYACCTFRGSIVAVDAATGATLWKRYAIPAPAVEQFKNALGVPQYGPSGAGVWSSPAIDRRRGLLYFATGNGYSEPGDENSNAIFALDLVSGGVKWRTQTLADDNWNAWDYFCRRDPQQSALPGCPSLKDPGPDLDFTASPVLVRGPNGQDILVAGRKDGTVFGVDPDSGTIRWTTRISQNPDPNAGALYFGLMAEGRTVFVPSISTYFPGAGAYIASPDDGLFALDAFTGRRLWAATVGANCPYKKRKCLGLAFAPIGISGAVFAGAADGMVRAYDTASGKVLWRFNTARKFKTLNGDSAKGGGVARNGLMIANGMVYVSSGWLRRPGNVLLAFAVAPKPTTSRVGTSPRAGAATAGDGKRRAP